MSSPLLAWVKQQPDIGTLILSGVINGLLMFVFCCVFSIIVFQDVREGETLKRFLPVGVSMHNFSAIVGAICFGMFSNCRPSIAGPDINPALFLALMVEQIQLGPNPNERMTDVDKIIPTSLFAIFVSTMLVGLTFFLLGHYRLTRISQYLPASLLNGFLACIGYKVMKAALTTACGDYYKYPHTYMFWKLLLPALPVGFGLYISKAYHIGKPAVSISVLLLVPLTIFYICIFAMGLDIETARLPCNDVETSASCPGGWFFPKFEEGRFYSVYENIDLGKIDFGAFFAGFKQFPAMLVIVVIDFLLKLAGTKKATGLEIAFDNEMKTASLACFLSAGMGASFPSYSQTKFTVLNIGITHNLQSRVPTVVCGLFNTILFFWGFPLINYLPRFFLGGLLIYAGLGFVVDNLIKSRNRVSREEFVAIWTILLVNAFVSLLAAVIVGVLLAAIIFAFTYGRLSVVKAYIQGTDYESRVVRSATDTRKLVHLAQRYAIVQMQNYIFFGSAGQVLNLSKQLVEEEKALPRPRRVTYLLFDWTNVYGIDYSGIGVFLDILGYLNKASVMVVFTGVNEKIMQQFLRENVLQKVAGVHDTMDFGVQWIEEQLLEWAHLVRSRWLEFNSTIKLHELAKNKAKHDALDEVLQGIGFGHELWRYINRIGLHKGEMLCWPGEQAKTMFIVQQGRFSAYVTEEDGSVRKVCTYARGAYINETAIFTSSTQMHKIIADSTNTIVLAITRDALDNLRRNRPDILIELQKTVLNFYRQHNLKLEREIGDLEHVQQRHQRLHHVEDTKKRKETMDGSSASSTRLLASVSFSWLHDKTLGRVFGAVPNTETGLAHVSEGSDYNNGSELYGSYEAPKGTVPVNEPKPGPPSGESSTVFQSFLTKRAGTNLSAGDLLPQRNTTRDTGIALVHAILKLSKHQNRKTLLELVASLKRQRTSNWEIALHLAHDDPEAVKLFRYHLDAYRQARYSKSLRDMDESKSLGQNESNHDADDYDNSENGILKLSEKEEKDCRACFKTHDKMNQGYIPSTALTGLLEDVGHFINQKQITMLIRTKEEALGEVAGCRSPTSGGYRLRSQDSRRALSMLLQETKSQVTRSRRIDPTDISRQSQIELISIFLASTEFFIDLENVIPGIVEVVANQSELLIFHAEESMCFEGSPVNSMFVVVDGEVKCSRAKELPKMVNASKGPLVFGENAIFLPIEEKPQHPISIEVISDRVIVVEVLKTVLLDAIGMDHPKRKQLQEKAMIAAPFSDWEMASGLNKPKRHLDSVISGQQKAPFGARFRALSGIDLFQEVVHNDKFLLSRVASESEVVEYQSRDFIFNQGDVGDFLLVVVAGDVQLMRNGEVIDTILFSKRNHGNGYLLGDLQILERNITRANDVIVTSERLIGLKISRASLRNIFEHSHNIWNTIRQKNRATNVKPTKRQPTVTKLGEKIFATSLRKLNRESSTASALTDHSATSSLSSCIDNKGGEITREASITNDSRIKIPLFDGPRSTDNNMAVPKLSETSFQRRRSFRRTGSLTSSGSGIISTISKGNVNENGNSVTGPTTSSVGLSPATSPTNGPTKAIGAMRVTEMDFLDMVNRLTFYPLLQIHLEVIEDIFNQYAILEDDDEEEDMDMDIGQSMYTKPLRPNGRAQKVITETQFRRLLRDGAVKVPGEALHQLFGEWNSGHHSRPDEACLTFSAFVSIIAAAIKREQIHWDVENVFRSIIECDAEMRGKLEATKAVGDQQLQGDDRWDQLAVNHGIGINPRVIKVAWKQLLDCDISEEACEEMVFEADPCNHGFLRFREWIDSIQTIHNCELESTETFERFESAVQHHHQNNKNDKNSSNHDSDAPNRASFKAKGMKFLTASSKSFMMNRKSSMKVGNSMKMRRVVPISKTPTPPAIQNNVIKEEA